MDISDWEAELQKQNLAGFEHQEPDIDQLQLAVASRDISLPTPSTASPPPSTLPAEEMDIVDMKRRGLEVEAQMVDISLGPLSLASASANFNFEEEFYGLGDLSKRRKKSIQKIAQLTGLMLGVEPVERRHVDKSPTSPLKEGFTFGEITGEGGDIEKNLQTPLCISGLLNRDQTRGIERREIAIPV